MTHLIVIGRSHRWFEDGLPLRFIGCVTTSYDKSNRDDDVVCSLPTESTAEAIRRGHELRAILLEQQFTDAPFNERLPASMVLS